MGDHIDTCCHVNSQQLTVKLFCPTCPVVLTSSECVFLYFLMSWHHLYACICPVIMTSTVCFFSFSVVMTSCVCVLCVLPFKPVVLTQFSPTDPALLTDPVSLKKIPGSHIWSLFITHVSVRISSVWILFS